MTTFQMEAMPLSARTKRAGSPTPLDNVILFLLQVRGLLCSFNVTLIPVVHCPCASDFTAKTKNLSSIYGVGGVGRT